MKIFFGLGSPFRFEKKVSKIEIDPLVFKECTTKAETIWSWKQVRRKKFLVHFTGGKFIIKELS